MDTKKCRKCGEEKSLEMFGKNSKTKDGRHSWCKKCVTEQSTKRLKERYHTDEEFRLNRLKKQREYKPKREKILKQQRIEDGTYNVWKMEDLRKKREYSWKNRDKIKPTKQNNKKSTYNPFSHKVKSHIKKQLRNNPLYSELNNQKIETKGDVHHLIPICWWKEDTPMEVINDLLNLKVVSRKVNQRIGKNILTEWLNEDFLNDVKQYLKPNYLYYFVSFDDLDLNNLN